MEKVSERRKPRDREETKCPGMSWNRREVDRLKQFKRQKRQDWWLTEQGRRQK